MPVIRQKRSGNITKSGAITILPKNQLKEIENRQGTIPIDLSINGHELINTDLKFDDSSRNYVFGQNYTFGNVSEGIPSEDNYFGNIISSPNTMGTSFSKNGTLSKEFLKDPRQRSNLSVSFRPYKEENQIEIDEANEFYVSGTSPLVSANFQQSLLSREKIEIDLPSNPSYPTAVSQTSTRKLSFPQEFALNTFSYYDFESTTYNWKQFNGFPTADGESERISNIFLGAPQYKVSEFEAEPERFAIPFSPSSWSRPHSTSPSQFISGSISEPISNFGFPFAKKYRPFPENLLKMSNYIDKPFLLEKIIIKCIKRNSIRIYRNLTSGQVFPNPITITTNLFVLNNRKIKSNRDINSFGNNTVTTLSGSELSYNLTGDVDKENFRELVTYAKLVTVTTGSIFFEGDSYGTKTTYNIDKAKDEADFYNFTTPTMQDVSNPSNAYVIVDESNTEVQIEVPVRQSIKNDTISHLQTWSANNFFYVGNKLGSRSLLGTDLNKSFVNNSDNYVTNRETYNSEYNADITFNKTNISNRQVPYVLYPEDELIIGASSFSNFYFENQFQYSGYIFDAKVILVGTPINDDRPKFEFDKRFLTSKNLRSGIIGDKFFTDRFDTLPIQLYASSSIDKIIESTGNRIIDRAVSGYYSNGNRGTHLKAVELQNSDIFITGSLLSEKAHFNYNSFGNFSDLYSQRKYTSYYKLGDNSVVYPVEKKFYNQITGVKLHQTGTLSFNSDFNSKISSPFEEL